MRDRGHNCERKRDVTCMRGLGRVLIDAKNQTLVFPLNGSTSKTWRLESKRWHCFWWVKTSVTVRKRSKCPKKNRKDYKEHPSYSCNSRSRSLIANPAARPSMTAIGTYHRAADQKPWPKVMSPKPVARSRTAPAKYRTIEIGRIATAGGTTNRSAP